MELGGLAAPDLGGIDYSVIYNSLFKHQRQQNKRAMANSVAAADTDDEEAREADFLKFKKKKKKNKGKKRSMAERRERQQQRLAEDSATVLSEFNSEAKTDAEDEDEDGNGAGEEIPWSPSPSPKRPRLASSSSEVESASESEEEPEQQQPQPQPRAVQPFGDFCLVIGRSSNIKPKTLQRKTSKQPKIESVDAKKADERAIGVEIGRRLAANAPLPHQFGWIEAIYEKRQALSLALLLPCRGAEAHRV